MSMSRTLVFGAALLLTAGAAAIAAQTSSRSSSTKSAKPAPATRHEEKGTVRSITSSALVLSHPVKGQQQQTTFKLEPTTKKEGTIHKGTHVAVYFKDQNHQRIATQVKAEPNKS